MDAQCPEMYTVDYNEASLDQNGNSTKAEKHQKLLKISFLLCQWLGQEWAHDKIQLKSCKESLAGFLRGLLLWKDINK